VKESLKKQADKLIFLVILLLGLLDFWWQGVFRDGGFGVENRGVSFGALQGISGVSLVVIWTLLLLVLIRSTRKSLWHGLPAWLMVVGGAVNLMGRIKFGGVWDYLRVPGINLWFNISDMMIVGGLGAFIFRK